MSNKTAAEVLGELRLPAQQVQIMVDQVLAVQDNLALLALARGNMVFNAKLRELTQSLAVATSLAVMLGEAEDFAALMNGAAFTNGDPALVKFGTQMLDWMARCKGVTGGDIAPQIYTERMAVIRAALVAEPAEETGSAN